MNKCVVSMFTIKIVYKKVNILFPQCKHWNVPFFYPQQFEFQAYANSIQIFFILVKRNQRLNYAPLNVRKSRSKVQLQCKKKNTDVSNTVKILCRNTCGKTQPHNKLLHCGILIMIFFHCFSWTVQFLTVSKKNHYQNPYSNRF